MKVLHPSFRAVLSSTVVLGLSTVAHAALYGNFAGPNITYQNVIENDSDLSGPPAVITTPTQLFGTPVLSPAGGDILTFPDNSFFSAAADGSFDLQDGKLTLDIIPTSLTGTIDSLTFDEGGGWKIEGADGIATSEATLLFSNLEITSVNNQPLAASIIVAPTFSQSFSVQDGLAVPVPVVGGPGDVAIESISSESDGTWDINAAFNLEAALANADMTGQITEVSVALDDQLFTQTTSTPTLTLAEIDKKYFTIAGSSTTTNTPVPEPASLSILLGAALLMRRPRNSKLIVD